VAVDFTIDDLAKQLRLLIKSQGRRSPDPLSQFVDAFREDRTTTVARLERILSAIPDDLRAEPDRIGSGERERIAATAGMSTDDIDRFMEQFHTIRRLMRAMAEMGLWERLKFILGWYSVPPVGHGRRPSDGDQDAEPGAASDRRGG
jgi:signal recognition particle GTPase